MFAKFCATHGLSYLPASNYTLLLFITHLSSKNLSLSTIKVYISSIITLHNINGLVPPNPKNPQIRLALRAISHASPEPEQKSPITFKLLHTIWNVASKLPEFRCIQAALALGFFGGMRGAEYLLTRFNPGPKLQQVQFVGKDCSAMNYTVLKSKTKPKGFVIPLSCSGHQVCAVCTMKAYLQFRHEPLELLGNKPLFLYQGSELSKAKMNAIIKDLVGSIGLPPSKFSLHSLRAGVATTAATSNFKPWELKLLGGWATNTFNAYIRPPAQHRRNFARRLARK